MKEVPEYLIKAKQFIDQTLLERGLYEVGPEELELEFSLWLILDLPLTVSGMRLGLMSVCKGSLKFLR